MREIGGSLSIQNELECRKVAIIFGECIAGLLFDMASNLVDSGHVCCDLTFGTAADEVDANVPDTVSAAQRTRENATAARAVHAANGEGNGFVAARTLFQILLGSGSCAGRTRVEVLSVAICQTFLFLVVS